MRKLLSVLLVVLLLVTAIACDPESGTGNDVTFDVSVNLKNVADKKESVAYVGDITWKYSAVKGDDGYTTGETTEEKELGDGNLGKLSLGTWNITLFGYEGDNLTYTGSVKTGNIVADTNVAVSVEKISKDAKVAFYATLADAVTGAEADDTITLVKDVEDVELTKVDKALTINLNEKTLSFKKGNNVLVSAKLVFNGDEKKKSTIKGSENSLFEVITNGDLTFNGVTVYASCSVTDSARAIAYVSQGSNPGKITVENSDLTMLGTYGIATNAGTEKGEQSKNVEITIRNSTIKTISKDGDKGDGKEDNVAVCVNVASTVIIEDSTISGERQGAMFRGVGATGKATDSTAVTIKNSTISATGTKAESDSRATGDWGSGNEVPRAALVIGNKTGNYHLATSVKLEEVTLNIAKDSVWKHIWVTQENSSYAVNVSGTVVDYQDSFLNETSSRNSATVNITAYSEE